MFAHIKCVCISYLQQLKGTYIVILSQVDENDARFRSLTSGGVHGRPHQKVVPSVSVHVDAAQTRPEIHVHRQLAITQHKPLHIAALLCFIFPYFLDYIN